MKSKLMVVCGILATAAWAAAPIKVALLDFEDLTGLPSDPLLGGTIRPGALAEKGVYLLGRQLLGSETFELVDRRDFLQQIERGRPLDANRPTPTRPSFLQAAQTLGAEVVLRGRLLSFSPGKQVVRQGGYDVEFVTLSLRVGVEALDTVGGAVIAMADGVASGQFRQTDQHFTQLSEEDALGLMEKALAQAVPALREALERRQSALAARPKVRLSVQTTADPALVEIDGILVGSTPLENFELYQGDHVLTVGKAGYRDVTKRILFEKDTRIEVPLIRTELSAEEWKDILEKIRLDVMIGEPALIIRTIED